MSSLLSYCFGNFSCLATAVILRRFFIMNKNKIVVPEAKDAMNKFKMEAANEVGVADTY